ncbi:circadian clock KaiB family protein [Coleofasciculus sp. FACHB-1120]|uniref:circadian clock KaiB family protein n=1 Tax=Coleofasciculus sp. FACHB-1120 TaxID=2692783 RepID=UPI0016889220|nr:circadian clock KaiB family protein [Coleofasciculus sp. FACHB-1120]MBD2744068.1 circadian clock protein KaiB [Coleofasciculus sp. FACHB-1120]
MTQNPLSIPQLFKGIALFTPGGDLIYCIDPNKQSHWHLHLCAGFQEMLGLPEPPHFLVPAYTATIDRWLDPYTQELRIAAEVYLPVRRHQALLNGIFQNINLHNWQVAPWPPELGDPIVLETYRHQFPQLWENHDLIVRLERTGFQPSFRPVSTPGYVLRLFVSGHNGATEHTLQSLHQLLEQSLGHPYTLKVIDIFKHPEQAESNQISATPTLVRVWPEPVRRIVGDLDNIERVLQVLGSVDY